MQTLLTYEQLETGLASLGDSPRDSGTLEMIVSRPAVDERVVLDEADLTLADGLSSDNWATRTSDTRSKEARLNAQITIMNSRVIQALAQERDRWALAGDQLYVDLDISEANLLPGQRLAVGTAILEVTAEPHTGCKKFSARFGVDATSFVNGPTVKHLRRRGLNARVVEPGAIHVGDIVSKI